MGGAPVSARRPSSFDQSHLPNIWQESHLWSRNDWPEPQIIAPHSRGLTCRQTGKPMDTHVSLDVVIFGLGHHSTLEIDGVSPLQVRVTTVNGRHLSVVSKIHKNAVWDRRSCHWNTDLLAEEHRWGDSLRWDGRMGDVPPSHSQGVGESRLSVTLGLETGALVVAGRDTE